MSISLPVSGYHHDLDTPVIIRHLIGMPGGLPLLQQERAAKSHHGLEAVHDRFRAFVQRIVAADTEQLLDTAAVSANHVVIQIPCIHAQRFPGVKRLPRLRRTETGQVQQALIHDRQRISHLLSILLGDGDGIRGIRFQLGGRLDDRSQMALRRSYRERDHAIQADRQIVLRDAMRLQKGDIDVSVRLHIFRHIQSHGRLFILARMFRQGKDTHAVLYTDNRTASFRGREGDYHLFAGRITILIGLETKHRGGLAAIGVTSALIIRPVEITHHSRRVLTLLIFHGDEIRSPLLIRKRELERTPAVPIRTDGKCLYRLIVGIRYVIGQTATVGVPPPIPIDFIYFHV